MELIPAGDPSYIAWVATTKSGKKTVTRRSLPGREQYAGHLAAASVKGPGAIGVKFSREVEAGVWVCQVLALDLDTMTVENLRSTAIVDTLEGLGIYVYVTTGSTGRGCHLYAFLQDVMLTSQAVRSLQGISDILRAEQPGLRVESFPSTATGGGQALYLPYRGGASNGLGANPLLDPRNGYKAIPLITAAKRVRRTHSDSLLNLASRQGLDGYRQLEELMADGGPKEPRDSLEALQKEVTRLLQHWKVGKRAVLAKALTAYALSELALEPQYAIDAVRQLQRKSGQVKRSPELDEAELLADSERTIKRFKGGLRVAWCPFYELAGIQPPPSFRENPAWLANVHGLRHQLETTTFCGRTAISDYAMYAALVRLAERYGRLHAEGIAISVSRRALALEANFGDTGAKRALKRLLDRGLVKRQASKRRQPGVAGTLVLRVNDSSCDKYPQSSLVVGKTPPENDWVHFLHHPAFRHGKLGQLGGRIVSLLVRAECRRLQLTHLAKLLDRPPSRLREPLRRLEHHGVIGTEAQPMVVILAEDFEARLDEAAVTTGANLVRGRQRERHETERASFQYSYENRRSSVGRKEAPGEAAVR